MIPRTLILLILASALSIGFCFDESALKDFFAHGTVDKGYKGELIVRLLMTLAMDKAMDKKETAELGFRRFVLRGRG